MVGELGDSCKLMILSEVELSEYKQFHRGCLLSTASLQTRPLMTKRSTDSETQNLKRIKMLNRTCPHRGFFESEPSEALPGQVSLTVRS